MTYRPEDGTWTVKRDAIGIGQARERFGEVAYEANKRTLSLFLCE